MNKLSFLLLLFLSLPLISSLDVFIDVKEEFGIGEKINFDYILKSSEDLELIYTSYIQCESLPMAFLEKSTLNLFANQQVVKNYEGETIDLNVNSQKCTAVVKILSPDVQMSEKNFSINTFSILDFKIILNKRIFSSGEEISTDYFSSVENPELTAKLVYPSGNVIQIIFPFNFLEVEEIGTYTLEVVASKKGYKPAKVTEQFAVIEKNAEFTNESICIVNNKCGGKEDKINCPDDCLSLFPVVKRVFWNRLFSILSGILGLVVLGIVFFLFIRSSRRV